MSAPHNLSKADLAMFKAIKVPVELLVAAGIKRVPDKEAREKWRISFKGDLAGIVFPYPSPSDECDLITCRVRRDRPEIIDGKAKNKYVQATAGPRCLYRPPGAAEKLRDRKAPVALVESEKAGLAMTAYAERNGNSLITLATGGCWGWSENKAPLAELEVCRGRPVTVLLDANAATNAQVKKARSALTQALLRMGCDVRIASLPQHEDVNGPDDLLATEEGDDALTTVLEEARPAEVAPHSDDALAERFYQRHGDDVRYVQAWGEWLVWDGQRWAKKTKRRKWLVSCRRCARRSPVNAKA